MQYNYAFVVSSKELTISRKEKKLFTHDINLFRKHFAVISFSLAMNLSVLSISNTWSVYIFLSASELSPNWHLCTRWLIRHMHGNRCEKPAGSVSSFWLTPAWIYFGGSDTPLQISVAPVNKQLIIVIVTSILFNERLLHFTFSKLNLINLLKMRYFFISLIFITNVHVSHCSTFSICVYQFSAYSSVMSFQLQS